MLNRILAGVWLIGLLVCIGIDVFSPAKEPTYTQYEVVSKGQEYSYHKNSQTQVNILILKSLKTGEIMDKNVTIETHFKSQVGSVLSFEDDNNHIWKTVMYLFFTILGAVALALLLGAYAFIYWIFTGGEP